MEKKLILVCSPPASGKTYISMKLAEYLKHVVYLDKDTAVPLSNVAFEVANQPNDRNGPFFEKYLRDVEYEVVLNFAYDALRYDDIVLINAPFSKEIRDKDYIQDLRKKLHKEYQARLIVVWVVTSIEVVHQRMIERNSPRDYFKLQDWDKFISSQNFTIPSHLDDPKVKDDLLLFYNDNEDQFNESMERILSIIQETN